MSMNAEQRDRIDNALLLLTFQEKIISKTATEEDKADYASLLNFKEAAKASYLISALLLRLFSAETGKTEEETIQLLREKLLQMSIQN